MIYVTISAASSTNSQQQIMKKNYPLLLVLMTLCSPGHGSGQVSPNDKMALQKPAVTLSDLAARADLVAVAQVKDTDYVHTRSFPSEGSAFLKVLIGYKTNRNNPDIIEVYEKGLYPNECYFENPTIFEEGRRYLVFFRINPENPDTYRGLSEGCALEILVSKDNRYALKYPVDGINLADGLSDLATRYDFHDNYALVSEATLSPAERDDLLARGLIIPYQDQFKYTHGIDLTSARQLIEANALSSVKSWK
jgi:hypothetical protein